MTSNTLLAALNRDAEFQRKFEADKRRWHRIDLATRWMRRIPVIGEYTASFWYLVLDEGIRTLKPRWGGITFAYLNDGMKPTVWHTWRQMTHDPTDPYTGIYPMGAPHSLKEAEEMEIKFREEKW